MKAYKTYDSSVEDEYYYLLVYANNATQAKYLAMETRNHSYGDECRYIDMRAVRIKGYDSNKVLRPCVIETNEELPEGCKPYYSDNLNDGLDEFF